jgi:hypothetical protein
MKLKDQLMETLKRNTLRKLYSWLEYTATGVIFEIFSHAGVFL